MKNLTKEEFVQILRPRQNAGISRSTSKYNRGAMNRCGEAQMNHFPGKKIFDTSAPERNEREALVSFELSSYQWNTDTSCPDIGAGRGQSLDLNLWISPSSEKNDNSKNSILFGKRLKIMDASTAPQDISTTPNHSSTWSSKQKQEIQGSRPWSNYPESQNGHGKSTMARPPPQFLPVYMQHHQDSNQQTLPLNALCMTSRPQL